MMYFVCFFFFKQKTAYEMRISDWSSDVCSSDLFDDCGEHARDEEHRPAPEIGDQIERRHRRAARLADRVECARQRQIVDVVRSEEHTSELQSLMRISYAVFCLKKKNTQ